VCSSDLDRVRSDVLSLRMPLGEALGYYTANHGEFLDVISLMSKESSDVGISSETVAYEQFLNAKERVGVERAVLANTFAADQFADGMHVKFLRLVAEQDTFLHEFHFYASEEQSHAYDKIAQGNSFKEVQRMRDIAMEHAEEGGFEVDSKQWFGTITQKINELKEFEDTIASDLQESASSLRASAATATVVTSVLVVGINALVLVIGTFISRSITRPLAAFDKSVQEMAEGDLDSSISIDTDDEIGALAKSFNTLNLAIRNKEEGQRKDLEDKVQKLLTVATAASAGDMTAKRPFDSDDSMGEQIGRAHV